MTFRIGQKVVCVAKPLGGYGDENVPCVGRIYTIRGFEFERPTGVERVGLLFEEIRNEPHHYTGYARPTEATFPASKFKPLVERKTDISIFTRMLNPSKQGVAA